MWDDAKQLNAIAAVLVLTATAMLMFGAFAWIARQPLFGFREVVVRAPLDRVSERHVEAVVRDELRGTFFTLDLDQARGSLAKIPWVRSVALRRQWPHRLEVAIEEHEALARWNDAALVNTRGEVFAAEFAGELPRFEGVDARAAEVAERYREWSAMLSPLGLEVAGVRLSARGGWHVTATAAGRDLAIELGRDEPTARLARFVAAYGRTIGALARSGTNIGQVDLRYRNGFAARVPGFRERPPKKV
jgi:cell division protein FtsQ